MGKILNDLSKNGELWWSRPDGKTEEMIEIHLVAGIDVKMFAREVCVNLCCLGVTKTCTAFALSH